MAPPREEAAFAIDRDAVSLLCRQYGVRRLALFGSATSDRFDPARSDVDFLVEFGADAPSTFDSYFGFKEALEGLVGRAVDLVEESAIINPYFARSVAASARELYAA